MFLFNTQSRQRNDILTIELFVSMNVFDIADLPEDGLERQGDAV